MAKYEISHDVLNRRIQELKGIQLEIVVDILKNNGRSIGGLIGSVTGMNGHYDLEHIYILNEDHDGYVVMCHLNYPAFEVDVDFYWLSLDERQQIVELLIREAQR